MKIKKILPLVLLTLALSISVPTYAGWKITSQTSHSYRGCAYITTKESFTFLGITWSTRTTTERVGDCSDPSFYIPR